MCEIDHNIAQVLRVKSNKGAKSSKAMLNQGKNSSLDLEALLKSLRKKGISAIASMSAAEQTQVASWAQDVFDVYGSVLEKYPGKIKNLSALPCSKQDIQIAIKILLPIWCTRESENMVNLLQDRYIRLSAFQKITEEDKDMIIREVNDIDQTLEKTVISKTLAVHKYMDLILAEQKVLLDEINSYINDLQIPKSDY